MGAQAFYFDLGAAAEVLPLTQAVLDAHDLGSARDALVALGTRTELDYELSRIPEQGRGAARPRRMIADTGRASAAVRARGED